MTQKLYYLLLEAGCELDNHESDLYIKVSPESTRIIDQSNLKFTTFFSKREKWYEIPFMYEPYWEAKRG